MEKEITQVHLRRSRLEVWKADRPPERGRCAAATLQRASIPTVTSILVLRVILAQHRGNTGTKVLVLKELPANHKEIVCHFRKFHPN